jgi:VanZ family protein
MHAGLTMRAWRLLPPLAWTAVIAWFSTDRWSGDQTASFLVPWLRVLLPAASPDLIASAHWLARKFAHVGEYAILAALWAWALDSHESRAAGTAVIGLSLATAVLDELYQATTAHRGGSPVDVFIDGLGVALGLGIARAGAAPSLPLLATILLWIAAAGGSLLLALSVAAGAPGGWLWLSTPAAWLALWWRRRGRGALRP